MILKLNEELRGLKLIQVNDELVVINTNINPSFKSWCVQFTLGGIAENLVRVGENEISPLRKVIIFATANLNLEGVPVIEENYWRVGNILEVTTTVEWEEPLPFPNHKEYKNMGFQTYVGEVIECEKGLALKTKCGKVFKTQGTYWFGSILNEKIKLIEKAQQNLLTSEDIEKAFEAGETYGRIDALFNATDRITRSEYESTTNKEEYLQLIKQPKVEITFDNDKPVKCILL